ncbi:stress response protein ElaB [Serratia quinivorans]|uniref:stress response protein ElaB n=1 Tax=Serratia quinivorans TaxID=137545 RepID=UPI003F985656
MARNTDADQTTLDDDLRMLSDTLEEVLKYSGDRADQAYIDIKTHAEEALSEVKSRLADSTESYYARAKDAVCRTDGYVHDNPWCSVGIGATVGLVLGLLLARK